ncbi:MAG TPA: carboxymuconolactone decarboxylase family protein [Halobacteria archaeon]|jgi:AhpD family alkylhydroperoxidase|nr:carboxymuconolactone decarboxylase family protein [Halobacteria archaeon]HIH77440.1 carboxymuconolactone decarboxylase family protein [Halobacteria archaeon]
MTQVEELFKEFDLVLKNKEELIDSLEKIVEEELGMVPFIIKEMEKRPEVLIPELLSVYYTTRPKSLDPKTAELIALAAAVANKSEGCISVHYDAALKCGATRDEILDVILISSVMAKTGVLATALRKYREKETK